MASTRGVAAAVDVCVTRREQLCELPAVERERARVGVANDRVRAAAAATDDPKGKLQKFAMPKTEIGVMERNRGGITSLNLPTNLVHTSQLGFARQPCAAKHAATASSHPLALPRITPDDAVGAQSVSD